MTTATKTKASSTTVTIPRTDLLDALNAVSDAVPSRAAKPIMQNVRIGDGLISGSDLEVRIDRAIAEVCEPFLVPFGRLHAIVKAATGDIVKFKPGQTSVTVQCGGGKWELPTEDVCEYPTWEPADLQAVCRLPGDQFARAAKATAYATDTESSRYALGSVLLEVKDGNPTFVATDGRRLSVVETETDQAVDNRNVLVPVSVLTIAASFATYGNSVQVEANASEIRVEIEGTTVTGRLIDGKFPRWRDVLGEMTGDPSVIDVAELLAAVRSAAIVTSEQSKGIDLRWDGDKLTLSARSSEYGESTVRCPLLAAGTTSSTKLDPRFLAEFLSHLTVDDEPQVDVYVTSPLERVLLKCGPYTGVIMPLDPTG